MLHAKISSCPNKRMEGRELRRLIRLSPNVNSELEVALELGTCRSTLRRRMDKAWVEFEPHIMEELLKILGASSL